MARPIYVTNDFRESIIEEFKKFLGETRMMDGEISFRKSYKYSSEKSQRVRVDFTPAAYAKMIGVLNHFSTEVAWHGSATRLEAKHFVINDIVVYPQTVTGATVTTDQEEYDKWSMSLDDEFFNSMRMQGHSHVNFSTDPSETDLTHQQAILSQLKGDDFYIFMIYNKRLESTIRIYDFESNTLFENNDIVTGILGEELDVEQFLKEADSKVKSKTFYSTTGKGSESVLKREYSLPSKKKDAKSPAAKPKEAKTPAKKAAKNPQYSFIEDGYDHPYGEVDYDALMFGRKEVF